MHLQLSWYPGYERVSKLENITLARTRDLLLAKLMSGEIRVTDAEGKMEVVA